MRAPWPTLAFVATMAAIVPAQTRDPHPGRPLVIAHRGASGHRPEHTLAAYRLAIEQGADFVEPDLVSTKDGVLVARHENEISGTTDVARHPEFQARETTRTIDGVTVRGWFTEDFTLAELKTLRARERLPQLRGTAFDGQFEVPTLPEILDLVAEASARPGARRIGVYPETKHPTYFRGRGLALEEPLLRLLREHGLTKADDPVFIQSFEVGNLKELRRSTALPLVQLVDAGGRPFDLAQAGDPRTYADLVTPDDLREIARYANAVGVHKDLVVPRDAQGRLQAPSTLVRDAHAAGLLVHAWTFRAENEFLPRDFQKGEGPQARGDLGGEIDRFLEAGLDGFFTDFPDEGAAARDRFLARR